MKYYEPDSIWENVWEYKTRDEFATKILKKGRFHKNVPENIIKEYETVEYLISHSYFHYPLIDEAFSKCTRIFEQSIHQRVKELGIKCSERETLNNKIKKLENYTSEELNKQWNNIRKIRNSFAHPKESSLRGITIINAFSHIITIINTIFLEKLVIEKKENEFKKIKSICSKYDNDLYILERKKLKYLIRSIIPYTSDLKSKKFLFVAHPVFKGLKSDSFNNIPMPFFLTLSDIDFKENGIEAKEKTSEELVRIYETTDKKNVKIRNEYINLLKQFEGSELDKYWFIVKNEIGKKISEFHYEHNW